MNRVDDLVKYRLKDTMKRCLINVIMIVCFIILLLGLYLHDSWSDMVDIEKISFEGWNHCYKITHQQIELIVVADIGPRILYAGLKDRENVFYIDQQTAGKTGGGEWLGYGGHRLWVAPELVDITYYPDNFECRVTVENGRVMIAAPPELLDAKFRTTLSFDRILESMKDASFRKQVRFWKKIILTPREDGAIVVDHQITNCGLVPFDIAPWALTVMNQGGICIAPNPDYAPHGPGHFLPVRTMSIWSYTDLADPRLKFMTNYVTFKQDPQATKPIKFGFSDTKGWIAYALDRQLFVKRLEYFPQETYPDMGTSVEIFTNQDIFEVESIGPLTNLKPGETATHREIWQLFSIDPIQQEQESIDRMVKSVGLQ